MVRCAAGNLPRFESAVLRCLSTSVFLTLPRPQLHPAPPLVRQAIYPISTTSEGSYRDPAIVQIVNDHNSGRA